MFEVRIARTNTILADLVFLTIFLFCTSSPGNSSETIADNLIKSPGMYAFAGTNLIKLEERNPTTVQSIKNLNCGNAYRPSLEFIHSDRLGAPSQVPDLIAIVPIEVRKDQSERMPGNPLPKEMEKHFDVTQFIGREKAATLRQRVEWRLFGVETLKQKIPGRETLTRVQLGYSSDLVQTNMLCFRGGQTFIVDSNAFLKTLSNLVGYTTSSNKGTAASPFRENRLCAMYLEEMESEKQMWAMKGRKQKGDAIPEQDFFGVGKAMPQCPDKGAYTLNPVGSPPTCSIHSDMESQTALEKKAGWQKWASEAAVREKIFFRWASSEEKKDRCVATLKELHGVKGQWALAERKKTGDFVQMSDLVEFGTYITYLPQCPERGTYLLGTVGKRPVCSISDHNQ